MQKEHCCGNSAQWSTWNTGLTWKSKDLFVSTDSVPADIHQQLTCISVVQCSYMTTSNCTWHSRLSMCCRSVVRKQQTVPIQSKFDSQRLSCFAPWSGTSQDMVSPFTQVSDIILLCGWHNSNIWSQQTYHMLLWEVPPPLTRLCHWHHHWDCQFPLLITCHYLLSVNLLPDPPSYLAINLQASTAIVWQQTPKHTNELSYIMVCIHILGLWINDMLKISCSGF